MQKEVTKKQNLLNEKGFLNQDGFSKKMIVPYNRENVKNKKRLKEWDYYCVSDSEVFLCLTISDLSFAKVLSASVVDLRTAKHFDKTSLSFSKKDKIELPLSSEKGRSHFKTKDAEFTFDVEKGKRHLFGVFKNFYKKTKTDLEFDVWLLDEPKESMVKITPFENKKHFYYNQKINLMTASGFFTFNGKRHVFNEFETLATLDWGRGVLPYRTKWYWASMSTFGLGGDRIGFNFGKALGNNSEATENMIFVNDKAHKIGTVDINIPVSNNKRNYLGTWTFYSDDGRVELIFEPIVDRYAPFNALILAFIPHQVFGLYSGKVILDDGTVVKIENKIGFAERVVNRW